jgi:hypothetical protein
MVFILLVINAIIIILIVFNFPSKGHRGLSHIFFICM